MLHFITALSVIWFIINYLFDQYVPYLADDDAFIVTESEKFTLTMEIPCFHLFRFFFFTTQLCLFSRARNSLSIKFRLEIPSNYTKTALFSAFREKSFLFENEREEFAFIMKNRANEELWVPRKKLYFSKGGENSAFKFSTFTHIDTSFCQNKGKRRKEKNETETITLWVFLGETGNILSRDDFPKCMALLEHFYKNIPKSLISRRHNILSFLEHM